MTNDNLIINDMTTDEIIKVGFSTDEYAFIFGRKLGNVTTAINTVLNTHVKFTRCEVGKAAMIELLHHLQHEIEQLNKVARNIELNLDD